MNINNNKYYNIDVFKNKLRNEVGFDLNRLIKEVSMFNIDITDDIARNYASSKGVYYDGYNLIYFKRYTSILKSKLEKILKISKYIISNANDDEINKLLNEVDIKIINVGDNKFICGEDINRLVRFIKLNFNILEEKYSKANDLKTYEKSEINLPKLFKKGLSESEIYPKDELQCEYFTNDPTYLDLSKGQKQFVLEKKIKNFKSCL